MLYEYLEKIKDFFIWFYDNTYHVEFWDEMGPI